jgi:hypothetical protein
MFSQSRHEIECSNKSSKPSWIGYEYSCDSVKSSVKCGVEDSEL